MKLKRLITVLGTGVATLGLVLGLNTPAFAHADGPELCITGSCVWFKNNGDYIYVNDAKADGHSAVAQVCAPADCSTTANYFWNSAGAGTTYYWSMSYIPEGMTVYYRPCVGESSTHTIVSCNSGWTHGTA